MNIKFRHSIQIILSYLIPKSVLAKIYFKKLMGYSLDLKKPKTLNEKIQYLKLYELPYNKTVIECTDKYAVRKYLLDVGYDKYCNNLLGVWNRVEDINWDSLPEKFILKMTHGCGYNVICRNKATMNKNQVIVQIKKWLKEDFGRFKVEPHYSRIKPRIIAEEFLGDNLIDYKFFCFNGKVKFMYIAEGSTSENEKESFFDRDGNKLDFYRKDYLTYEEAKVPTEFNKMVELSENLSKNFTFVRVDWYCVDGRIIFGEMTFSPGGGYIKFSSYDVDLKYGELLEI